MKELFAVLIEFQSETSIGGIFESEQLAREYIATLSSKHLEADPMEGFIVVDDRLYVAIQKCQLNEHEIIV